ncbi:uncharacterized protein [Lolium perenne]|uniref:uncharacterized protein n=1 Tax=Lolium perenne TaxID=4522 RepID=UPI0021EADEB7
MAACQTRKRERGEALEAADGDVVANGVVSKTFGEAVFVLVPGTGSLNPYSHRVGAAAVSDSEVVFFSDDESEEDDWEEDGVLLEEGPEVVDPPATHGVEGCGEQLGGRALDTPRDEDEYVDIEGLSDSEEHDYDGEVID